MTFMRCICLHSPMWLPRSFHLAVLVTGLLAFFSGCSDAEGPERFPVSGSVKLDGNELASGVIRFIPTGGTQGPAASTAVQNGKYQFSDSDGPIAGAHRVEIEATEHLGFAIDDEAAFAKTVMQRGKGGLPKNPIPEVYNRQSTLQANVTADGSLEHNFDLTTRDPRSPAR